MAKQITIIFSLIFLVLLVSCVEKRMKVPDNIVSEEKLVSLLVDIHLTDALLMKEKRPHAEKYEKSIKIYPAVLLKHNIDRTVFDSTIRFYVKYPKVFSLIYDEVLRELSIMEGTIQKTSGMIEEGEE